MLPGIDAALPYGYAQIAGPDDLYHSPQWLAMDEEVKIARPFSVLSFPRGTEGSTGPSGPAHAGTWGLIVEQSAFWPFMRADSVLSLLAGERSVPLPGGPDHLERCLMPSAYVGALRGGTTRLPARPGLPAADTRAALTDVLDGVETMARAEGLRSIACLYLPGEDLIGREVLAGNGYYCFGLAHYVAVLRVTSFADYLAGLSKGRRDNLRSERKKIARAGVEIAVEPLSAQLSEQMLPLEAQLYHKYGHETHPTEMARILHHAVIDAFGGDAPVITARAGGVLRGYAAFIRAGATLYSRDVGFDYTWEERLPLYFDLLFYRAVELAERLGASEINYSYASEQTKVSHGCELLPRVGYVKPLDPRFEAELSVLCGEIAAAGDPVG
jgi:hypothetical protein